MLLNYKNLSYYGFSSLYLWALSLVPSIIEFIENKVLTWFLLLFEVLSSLNVIRFIYLYIYRLNNLT